jgi:hypothetical protein
MTSARAAQSAITRVVKRLPVCVAVLMIRCEER